ncbi:DUF1176 domain-containing protein [Synechococcus moorigangaii CMS01]|nr:DUF1176 domain-containing protein [Synechococcus moorigangaii CMS01]
MCIRDRLCSAALVLGSCQNPSTEEVSTPQSPPDNPTAETETPIPVPAEPLPLTNSRPADTKGLSEDKQNDYSSPDLSAQILPELIKNRESLQLCQDFRFEPELTEVASNVYRVGENDYLVHLVCGSTAYQLLQDYFLYQKTTGQPNLTSLPITFFDRDQNGELIEETEMTMAGYSEYDPVTKTVNIFTKARGLGDCGSLGFYRFTGTELRLDRFLMKDECDGNYIEPINYPQVYP